MINLHLWTARWSEFTCSDFHERIKPVFNAKMTEKPLCTSSIDLWFYPLQTEISPDSLNLLMIFGDCRRWHHSLHNFTLTNIIQKFANSVLQIGEPMPNFSSVKFFISNHLTAQLPINLISCKMLLQLFPLTTTYFSAFCPLPWDMRQCSGHATVYYIGRNPNPLNTHIYTVFLLVFNY